jgi:hypothetical protein
VILRGGGIRKHRKSIGEAVSGAGRHRQGLLPRGRTERQIGETGPPILSRRLVFTGDPLTIKRSERMTGNSSVIR